MSWWNGYYWVLPYLKFIFVSPVSQTLMHIHVFAKQMYKYTLWVSENWYPLRKIYYKCLSERLGKEKFSCDICFYWHFSAVWTARVVYRGVRCLSGRGWKARGGWVASLARRNAWLEFQMDLSLSLSHSVVIVNCWVVTTLKMTNLTWSTVTVARNYSSWQLTLICWQSPLSLAYCLYLPVLSDLKAVWCLLPGASPPRSWDGPRNIQCRERLGVPWRCRHWAECPWFLLVTTGHGRLTSDLSLPLTPAHRVDWVR